MLNISNEEQVKASIEIIEEMIKECTIKKMTIELEPDVTPTIFDNKLAGLGYVPHDAEIPVNTSNNRQLALLCQINCKDITIDDFPKEGLLQFWIDVYSDLIGANFDNSTRQEGFRIIYYPTVDTTVTAEEVQSKVITYDDEEEIFPPVEREVAFKLIESEDMISINDYRFDRIFAEKFNARFPGNDLKSLIGLDIDYDDITDAADDNHKDVVYLIEKSGWGHKISGYPNFTQNDPRDIDKFDTLLLQIDSDRIDDKHEIIWGDCGIANFFINREALKNLDFSEVIYNWDCY